MAAIFPHGCMGEPTDSGRINLVTNSPRNGVPVAEVNDWNQRVIDEFRANGGKVGGQFADAPMLLLTTTGARSGKSRVNPMMYLSDGDRLLVFASKGGAPTNPDWYHNLVANPRASVEVGTETFEVDAEVLAGEERDRLYAEQARRYPGFAEYQAKTSRQIPVVALRRKEG
jgi:deazaflavin-dependent oxidoreductase (nitroreductase family)